MEADHPDIVLMRRLRGIEGGANFLPRNLGAGQLRATGYLAFLALSAAAIIATAALFYWLAGAR